MLFSKTIFLQIVFTPFKNLSNIKKIVFLFIVLKLSSQSKVILNRTPKIIKKHDKDKMKRINRLLLLYIFK